MEVNPDLLCKKYPAFIGSPAACCHIVVSNASAESHAAAGVIGTPNLKRNPKGSPDTQNSFI